MADKILNKCSACLLLLSTFLCSIPTSNAILQQIPYHQRSFNRTFRRDSTSSQNIVELVIEASTGLVESPIEGIHSGTYLYCLGSTKVEVRGIQSDLKISQGDSLIEVRDRLQSQMPNQIWSILTRVRGGGETGREHVEVRQLYGFSPYVDKYLAASSKHPISITVKRNILEPLNLVFLLVGIVLLFNAPKIAQQAALWYLGGVSLSVTIGALIMLYFILNRLIPKRDSILVVGFLSSVGVWIEWFFNGFLRQTIFGLMRNHWTYVVLYFLVFGVAGFIYCYIKGPHTENPRITNVIQGTLQMLASALIVYAFNIPEIGFGMLLVLILTYIFYPQSSTKVYDLDQQGPNCNLIHAGQSRRNLSREENSKCEGQEGNSGDGLSLRKKSRRNSYVPIPTLIIPRNRPKRRSLLPSFLQRSPVSSSTPLASKPFRRLMTEDEYLVQGLNTTQNELDRLRKYCRESKESSPWKVMQHLDEPKRFASFVTGSPHVSQTELNDFEHELDSILTGGGSDSDESNNDESRSTSFQEIPCQSTELSPRAAKAAALEQDKENSNESTSSSGVQNVSRRDTITTSVVAAAPSAVSQRKKLR